MKKLILALSLLISVFNTNAQSKDDKKEEKDKISFDVKISDEPIVAGQNFTITYTLKGAQGENFSLETSGIENAKILYGPSTQFSSQTTTNPESGKLLTYISQSYIYVAQADEKAGTVIIPDATIEVNGEKYTAKGLKIKSVKEKGNKGSSNKKGSSQSQPSPKAQNKPKENMEISDKDVFIKTEISRKAAGIGESIEITYRLYTKWDVASIADYRFPDFTGFNVKPVSTSGGDDFTEEKYNGQKYKVSDIKKFVISAPKAGDYTIEPFTLTLFLETEKDEKKRESMSRNDRYESLVRKKISSEKITVLVGTIL
ncbi:MAG: BatD family protein [Dysgonomonas sp.]